MSAAALGLVACHSAQRSAHNPSTSPSSATAATESASTSSPGSSTPSTPSNQYLYSGYVPLWPFTGLSDAAAWESSYQASKVDPWHLDPDATALSFTRDYLGFTDINRIVSRSVRSDGEHLGVGYLNPNAVAATAATLHLIRLGTDSNAPWQRRHHPHPGHTSLLSRDLPTHHRRRKNHRCRREHRRDRPPPGLTPTAGPHSRDTSRRNIPTMDHDNHVPHNLSRTADYHCCHRRAPADRGTFRDHGRNTELVTLTGLSQAVAPQRQARQAQRQFPDRVGAPLDSPGPDLRHKS